MWYTRYTLHIIELIHINIVVISTWIYAVCSQSVMIDTWQLYRKHFAWCRYYYMMVKYQMDDLHVTVNTWWSLAKCTICMFQVWVHEACIICTVALVSAEFFAVWVSIHVHISLEFVGLTILPSFANCSCILVLNCDPHTCRYG